MAEHRVTKGAERQKAYEERMREGGYKRMCFWVHESDAQRVKTAVNEIVYEEPTDD